MWTPELELQGSVALALLIALLHGLAGVALVQAGGHWPLLIPLVVASGVFHILRDGLKRLPGSVQRIWLDADGWHLQRRDGQQQGPFVLGPASRIDSFFIRLSLRQPGRLGTRHLILTPAMIGPDQFRRLQVFLRWSPEVNQTGG